MSTHTVMTHALTDAEWLATPCMLAVESPALTDAEWLATPTAFAPGVSLAKAGDPVAPAWLSRMPIGSAPMLRRNDLRALSVVFGSLARMGG